MDYYDYIHDIERLHKIKFMQSGAYARVYQHPVYHNVVVKIFREDDAYASYLNWCVKHQDNPFVPQIADVKRIRTEFTIVFLEKLKNSSSVARQVLCKQIMTRCPIYGGIDMLTCGDWKYISRKVSDVALTQIAKFLATTKHELDLHPGNIMMRTNGQLVFTDPIA